jgi:hypothetical protein
MEMWGVGCERPGDPFFPSSPPTHVLCRQLAPSLPLLIHILKDDAHLQLCRAESVMIASLSSLTHPSQQELGVPVSK